MNHPPRGLIGWLPFLWQRVLFPHAAAPVEPIRWRSVFILLTLGVLLLTPAMGHHLLEPDEGRYAQIAREMVTSGEWIVPHLQGKPYLDKPPLFYWLTALSFSLFGIGEISARVVPAVATLGTILLIYFLGRRTLGERSGFWGSLFLALCPGFLGMSRLIILDGLLCFWVTLSVAAALEAIRKERFSPAWWYVSAVAAGFGVLTKGPVPFLLLVPPLFAYCYLNGLSLPRKHALGFLGVALVMNLPWYVAIGLAQPVFLRYFFWEHNFLRFVQPFDHLQPVWYFVPVIIGGMLPFVFLAIPFVRNLLVSDSQEEGQRPITLGYYLLVGLWTVLFFSMSGSKLPTYVLPAFPFLCLVLGHYVAHSRWSRHWLMKSTLVSTTVVLLVLSSIGLPWYAQYRSPVGREEIRQVLEQERLTPMIAFPRSCDSAAFYTQRADIVSMRSKYNRELLESLRQRDRTIVILTHRHSLGMLKEQLPADLKIVAEYHACKPKSEQGLLEKLIGDGPWGLSDVAIVERVK